MKPRPASRAVELALQRALIELNEAAFACLDAARADRIAALVESVEVELVEARS
ncbi:MAG: hypothetical protein ACYCZB_03085 [Acidiphilium sp.]